MVRNVERMTAARRLVPRAAAACVAAVGVLAYAQLWLPAAFAGADDVVRGTWNRSGPSLPR